MNSQPLRNRLAAIALLLQVVSVFGATRGLVLCVGAAGHVAVEDYEAAARCQASESALDADGYSEVLALGSSPACVDTPLFGVAPEQSTSPLRFAAVLPALAPVAELRFLGGFAGRAGWTHEPPRRSARFLRSVVLLV